MKERRQFVRKTQDTKFRRCQTWGVRTANQSTLSSNILDNDKAQKALQKLAANRLSSNNCVALDRKKQHQLLEIKKSITKNGSSELDAVNQSPFEITRATKKKILEQIKNKQKIDLICFEFMISDTKFQADVFNSKNLADNQIFIDYLRKNIDSRLSDAAKKKEWQKDSVKQFNPDQALISKKKKRQGHYDHARVFKFKFGILEIPKDVWVKVYSGGLPSLGKRSR